MEEERQKAQEFCSQELVDLKASTLHDVDLGIVVSGREGEDIPYTPRHKYGLGVSYDNPGIIRIDADMRFTGSRYDVLMWEVPGSDRLPEYYTCNLRLSRGLNRFAEVSLAFENIFDKEYEITYSPDTGSLLLSPGMIITLGVTARF